MTKEMWRAIAVGEFLMLVIGISLGILYFAYRQGALNDGAKGIIEILANIAYLIYFLAGSTGWMLLVGVWGGLDDDWTG